MKSVMSTSFLKPRNKGSGEGQSKYALLGQRMEGPVLKAFFQWCTARGQDDAYDGIYEALYQPGLVMRLDQPYVRGLADGVLIFNPNVDETQYCVPVEVKARVSPIRMPCGAGMSGYTPGKSASVIMPSAQFVHRCRTCNGKYPAKIIPEDRLKNKTPERILNQKRKKDTRQRSNFCKGKAKSYCFGCQ